MNWRIRTPSGETRTFGTEPNELTPFWCDTHARAFDVDCMPTALEPCETRRVFEAPRADNGPLFAGVTP